MALELSSIGVKLKWCCETTAGTRPTTGFTEIPDIKSTPDAALNPSRIEVSNMVDAVRRYIPGILEGGDDMAFTANLTADLKTKWAALVTAADTAFAAGKATWFEICIPNFDSFYFSGMPSELGLNSMGVSVVAETTLHVVPNSIVGFAAASTT